MKNILLKYFVVNIAFLFSFPLHAQININEDTILIREVVISRKLHNSGMNGYNKTDFDSTVLNNYRQENMSDMISGNSLIFVKSYGLGGSATTSIRGAGASHTQITWNGININNPMAGQSDLSLIPVCFIDDVHIYYGGASMALNSGGIGGIINIETNPVWKKETSLTLNPGIGSFGKYTGSLQVKSGNANFQTVTKVFLESSENNFRYLNSELFSEPAWETRKNAQVRQQGYMQELYFKKASSVTSARIWYQSASRNLPASMVVQDVNSGERQFDESLRGMMDFKTYRGNWNYSVTGALMLNKLNYFNRLASIDSRNLSDKLSVKTTMETLLAENTALKFSLNNELSVVKSNNYDQNASRNVVNVTASFEKMTGDRLGTTILIREIINNKAFLIPDFTAGLEYKILRGKEYFLKGNISRNSKVPDLNDLFWIPGGNNNLKNEYAFSEELIYEMTEKISSLINFNFDISLFRNLIRDMIQWRPGEFSYWTADNIQRVNSTGTETSLAMTCSLRDLTAKLKAQYSYTSVKNAGQISADIDLKGKQLIYIPENQLNAKLQLWYKKFTASWMTDYTGIRFTSSDNSGYLPDFLTNNIKAGYKFDIKGISIDLNLDIYNLFDISYQVIAWHPMPGRYYSFGILFHLIK